MEPDIAPLAKRLAEENNVNWQHLQGSGANGRIVERDVLEYLARVMSGEEDLNPTPEPVPEGMQAWPEQDVQGYFAEQASSSSPTTVQDFEADEDLLDVSDGLYDSKSFSEDDLDFSADLPQANALNDDKLDEDVFLFDDDLLSADFSESGSSEPIVEAENFEDVDMLLDDSDFELEDEQAETSLIAEDSFRTEDPFAEADAGFAFENAFAEATEEAETVDLDVDTFLLEDSEDLGLSAEEEAVSSLLDDDLEDMPSSQQAAHEAADELFSVDLDDDLGFDEDVASLFVDEQEAQEGFVAESLEPASEDLLAPDEDDFAVDALNDLLPEDVLPEDELVDAMSQVADEVPTISAMSEEKPDTDYSADTDDLFVDSEAEALLDASDELFSLDEESKDAFAIAEEQADDSLFDFSEPVAEEAPDEDLSFVNQADELVEEDFDAFADASADPGSENLDLDFEANADAFVPFAEESAEPVGLEPESQVVTEVEEIEQEDLSFAQAKDEPALTDMTHTEVVASEEVFEEDLLQEVAAVAAEPAAEQTQPESISQEVETMPVAAPIPFSSAPQSSPFMSFGLLLRRHIEADALQTLRTIASEELQRESIDLNVFLLRAAAKAVGENIAFANIQDNQIELKQVKPSFNVSFRETLAAFDKASTVQDLSQLTLIVANMSDLDIDEAVLNLPVPVLTLGRLHAGQMTLTLSGNIPAEKGSSLLSEIAALLSNPVRLLV